MTLRIKTSSGWRDLPESGPVAGQGKLRLLGEDGWYVHTPPSPTAFPLKVRTATGWVTALWMGLFVYPDEWVVIHQVGLPGLMSPWYVVRLYDGSDMVCPQTVTGEAIDTLPDGTAHMRAIPASFYCDAPGELTGPDDGRAGFYPDVSVQPSGQLAILDANQAGSGPGAHPYASLSAQARGWTTVSIPVPGDWYYLPPRTVRVQQVLHLVVDLRFVRDHLSAADVTGAEIVFTGRYSYSAGDRRAGEITVNPAAVSWGLIETTGGVRDVVDTTIGPQSLYTGVAEGDRVSVARPPTTAVLQDLRPLADVVGDPVMDDFGAAVIYNFGDLPVDVAVTDEVGNPLDYDFDSPPEDWPANAYEEWTDGGAHHVPHGAYSGFDSFTHVRSVPLGELNTVDHLDFSVYVESTELLSPPARTYFMQTRPGGPTVERPTDGQTWEFNVDLEPVVVRVLTG